MIKLLSKYIILEQKKEILKSALFEVHGISYSFKLSSINKTLVEKIHEIDIIEAELLEIKKIIKSIDCFKDRTLIEYKFIMGYSSEKIGYLMGYSKRQINRRIKQIIKRIEENNV